MNAFPQQSLRVLTVTNMYPTTDRPTLGTFVAEQVSSLRARGLHVDVLFVDGPASKANYLRGPWAVWRALTAKPYDLIHAHYVFSGLIAALTRLGPGRRLPLVLTHHGIETQQGWTVGLCRAASRLADVTIATSRRVAANLGGAQPVTIIPCGVDVDLFRPLSRSAARQALNQPPDRPLILFVGAPRPEKRLPLIRAAIDQLRATVPAVELLVVHGLPREVIPTYMNAADVLVLASTAEGSPMVVREAMACNLPAVCTDVGDVSELFAGLPGYFIAGPDAGELADKLRAALAFGARTAARDRVVPWSLAEVAGMVEEVYRDVSARRTAPKRIA